MGCMSREKLGAAAPGRSAATMIRIPSIFSDIDFLRSQSEVYMIYRSAPRATDQINGAVSETAEKHARDLAPAKNEYEHQSASSHDTLVRMLTRLRKKSSERAKWENLGVAK